MLRNIEWVPASALKPAAWRARYILTREREVLRRSLKAFGWAAPIIAHKDGTIIDGHARWEIATGDPELQPIPVIFAECDTSEAIMSHLWLNTAGETIPKLLSRTLKKLKRLRKYKEKEIVELLNMDWDEFDILMAGTIIKARKIEQHEYSSAWVPVETSGKSVPIQIERPPGKDE